MSQKVDPKRVAQFRKDRKLLPYDDIVIAKNMRVDRSNFSKVTNDGPITNAFLNKFYAAFGDEIKTIKEWVPPVERGEVVVQLKAIEQQVEQIFKDTDKRIEQLEQRMEILLSGNLAKVERILSMLSDKNKE